ncbi:THAP domain-containing protein 11 [Ambystoma mexicanum]|uniref:THAP domain-containing protein 11 n=1 Tax=Ambystoma mexicanum TaxID=8296 RepID=UPI0037E8C2D1
MPGFTCCVPGCYSNSHRDKGLHFYTFPKDPELRRLWLKNVSRAGVSGCFSTFQPTTGHRLCSLHFPGGRKTYSLRVPTIFPLRGVNEQRRTRRGGGRGRKQLALQPPPPVLYYGPGDEPTPEEAHEVEVVVVGDNDTRPIDLTVQAEAEAAALLGAGVSRPLRMLLMRDEDGLNEEMRLGSPACARAASADHSYSLSSGTTAEELLRKLNEQRDIIALMQVKMKEMKASIRHLRGSEVRLREEIRHKDRLLLSSNHCM